MAGYASSYVYRVSLGAALMTSIVPTNANAQEGVGPVQSVQCTTRGPGIPDQENQKKGVGVDRTHGFCFKVRGYDPRDKSLETLLVEVTNVDLPDPAQPGAQNSYHGRYSLEQLAEIMARPNPDDRVIRVPKAAINVQQAWKWQQLRPGN